MPDETLRYVAYAVAYITFIAGLFTTGLRFYSRAVLMKQWGWDDYSSIAVFFANIGQQAVLQMLLSLGCGSPGEIKCSFQDVPLFKVAFVEEIVIYLLHFTIKTTFLLFFLRLSGNTRFQKFVLAGVVLNSSIFITSMLLTFLQCIPFQETIEPGSYPNATCLDQLTVMIVPPVLNIAMDLYILILPIATVWHLQMPLRGKLEVVSVMTFGVCSVAIACARVPIIISLFSNPDTSSQLGKMVIIAAVEIQAAIVAVNLPCIKSFWSRFRSRNLTESSGGTPGARAYYRMPFMGKRSNGDKSDGEGMPLGTVTRLERGMPSTESEERLFEQSKGDGPKRSPEGTEGPHDVKRSSRNGIMVTTKVDVVSEGESPSGRDSPQQRIITMYNKV
ncbi:hypothetical protein VPNG_01523 [Cytospora leucostoma]|uniref:Rhodopsin domain-containing protein n=1 Tax=Cytospora leucostoma TaxID=1230097 RepID=A0A423XKD7_9PEZI|nr:hypothetical protein VPNG_01523 [Cytospora leucostoma]